MEQKPLRGHGVEQLLPVVKNLPYANTSESLLATLRYYQTLPHGDNFDKSLGSSQSRNDSDTT